MDGKSICYVLLDYLEDDLPGEDYDYEERWKSFDETARSAYRSAGIPDIQKRQDAIREAYEEALFK